AIWLYESATESAARHGQRVADQRVDPGGSYGPLDRRHPELGRRVPDGADERAVCPVGARAGGRQRSSTPRRDLLGIEAVDAACRERRQRAARAGGADPFECNLFPRRDVSEEVL